MRERPTVAVLLRLAALVVFAIAAVLCFVTDTPDVFTVLGLVNAGLALWVAGTIAP